MAHKTYYAKLSHAAVGFGLCIASSWIVGTIEHYDSAGVLPIVKIKNNMYIGLEKKPAIRQLDVHGEFAGIPSKRDFGQPYLTAARAFSERADINYKDVFSLFREQCPAKKCLLKSSNNRVFIFPLLVTIDVLDDLKVPFALVSLHNLEEAINYALRSNKTNNIFTVAQGGSVVKLRKELVEALINQTKTKNNIFKTLRKPT